MKTAEAGTKNSSIPTEVLRSNKKSCHKEIKTPFISIFNTNNTNVFPSIKHIYTFNNLKQPNTMTDVFHDFSLVHSRHIM